MCYVLCVLCAMYYVLTNVPLNNVPLSNVPPTLQLGFYRLLLLVPPRRRHARRRQPWSRLLITIGLT